MKTKTVKLTIAVVALSLLAPGAAVAQTSGERTPGYPGAWQSISRPAPAYGLAAQTRANNPVAVTSAGNDFDFADAAVGAGIGLGAVLVLVGGAYGVRGQRRLAHRSRAR